MVFNTVSSPIRLWQLWWQMLARSLDYPVGLACSSFAKNLRLYI
jgi:hypothetical protein